MLSLLSSLLKSSSYRWGAILGFFLLGLILVNHGLSMAQAEENFRKESKQVAQLDQSRVEEVLRLLQELLVLVAEDPFVHTFVDAGGSLPPHSKSRITPAFDFLSRRLQLQGLFVVGFKPATRVHLALQGESTILPEMDKVLTSLGASVFENREFLTASVPQLPQDFLYARAIRHKGSVVGFVALVVSQQQVLEGVSDVTLSVAERHSGLVIKNPTFGGEGELFSHSVSDPDYPDWELKASRPDAEFAERADVLSVTRQTWFSVLGVALALGLAAMWLNRRQVLEQSRAKSEFLATLSHEIRNPLSGILSINKLARETSLDPLQAEYLDISSRAAESTLRLLQDTLEMSRLESGTLVLRPTDTDLRELLQEVSETVVLQVKKKGLEFHLDLGDAVPRWVSLDGVRLRQVISNLLGNAIKFTTSGSVGLSVDWKSGVLSVIVTDTGCGIPPDKLDAIFEPYQQAGAGDHEGVGLGLHISSEIIKAMDGQLWAKSEQGSGAIFGFQLGLKVVEAKLEVGRAEAVDGEPVVTPRPETAKDVHLLLAEDSPIHQRFTTRMLQSAGYQVDLAVDGKEALSMAQKGEYDLLLLDVRMPEMSGLQVAKALRKDKRTSLLPIIGLTANSVGRDKDDCLESGMDRYLAKPYDDSELLSLVQELIPHRIPMASGASKRESNPTLFHPERSLMAVGGDPETLAALTDFFIRQYPEVMQRLMEARSSGNTASAAEEAKNLADMVAPFVEEGLPAHILELADLSSERDQQVELELKRLCQELSVFTKKERSESA